MATTRERDWMFLPDLVLASILSCLVDNLEDCVSHVRFSVVCKHWHSVAKQQTRNFPLVVLLPPKDEDRKSYQFWCVYGLTQKRLLNFKLRVPRSQEFYRHQSSYGWLVGFRPRKVITLFNPFTQSEIRLPPVMDDISERYTICAVILSADPSLHPNDYIVAAHVQHELRIHFSRKARFAWIRPGRDHKWTYSVAKYFVDHIAFDKTRKWLYAIGASGSVERADLDAHSEQTTLEMVVQPCINNRHRSEYDSYLVETTLNKDLLVIFRLKGESTFEVFKLQEDSSFVEVNDLNGDAVFIGHGSYCALARDLRGIEANCIYHVDECHTYRVRTFNVNDKTTSYFDTLTNDKLLFAHSPVFWISPTINL